MINELASALHETPFDTSNLDPDLVQQTLQVLGFMDRTSWNKFGKPTNNFIMTYRSLVQEKNEQADIAKSKKEAKSQRQSELRNKLPQLLDIGLDSTENPYLTEYEEKGTIQHLDPTKISNHLKKMSGGLHLSEDFSVVENIKSNQAKANELGLTHKQIVEPLQRIYIDYLSDLFDPKSATHDGASYQKSFIWRDKTYTVTTRGRIRSPFVESPFCDRKNTDDEIFSSLIAPPEGMMIEDENGNFVTLYGTNIHLARDLGIYLDEDDFSLQHIVNFFKLTESSEE